MLQIQALQAGYGASKVLFGVDLEIAPRQVVSLIGRNGMGKTTTVKTLMGMLPAQDGAILLDGKPIAGLPRTASRSWASAWFPKAAAFSVRCRWRKTWSPPPAIPARAGTWNAYSSCSRA